MACQPVSSMGSLRISWILCETTYSVDMTVNDVEPTKGWTADDSTFGARLALIRQRMAWGNVKEAAVACGLPPESWRTWERDNVAPRRVVEVAAIISEKTGCDFGWLLAGQRLTTYVATRGAQGDRINDRKATLSDRTRPNGGPTHSIPKQATRRPARLTSALAGS